MFSKAQWDKEKINIEIALKVYFSEGTYFSPFSSVTNILHSNLDLLFPNFLHYPKKQRTAKFAPQWNICLSLVSCAGKDVVPRETLREGLIWDGHSPVSQSSKETDWDPWKWCQKTQQHHWERQRRCWKGISLGVLGICVHQAVLFLFLELTLLWRLSVFRLFSFKKKHLRWFNAIYWANIFLNEQSGKSRHISTGKKAQF